MRAPLPMTAAGALLVAAPPRRPGVGHPGGERTLKHSGTQLGLGRETVAGTPAAAHRAGSLVQLCGR
jgi:hypothetical protein